MSEAIDTPLKTPAEIGEFQGLYGTFQVSEVLLQKIWLRQQFAVDRAKTTAGDSIVVRSPGRWNRLSGPDFHEARLEIGGQSVTGSVEVHFHVEAWKQHRHHLDHAYDDVVLHVVLFPPDPSAQRAQTSGGREIPTLALIDLLWQDLEAYAEDEAVAALAGRDPIPLLEDLLARGEGERAAIIAESTERRWRQKVHFARLRVERLGWDEACHQTALEILGYRQNRVSMLQVATRFGWEAWQRGVSIEDALATVAESWTTRGVRPANHPRLRLRQYADWIARVRDWPARLQAFGLQPAEAAPAHANGGRQRKQLGSKRLREGIALGLMGGAIGGTRLDTMMVDLVFPFLAVSGQDQAAFAQWRAWYPGDMPDSLRVVARHLASRADGGLTNGLLQALWGLVLQALQREFSAER